MDNVAPILASDKALMLQHLELLFARAMEGRIEITAIKAAPREEHHAPRTRFFDVDELDEAATWAADVNAEHMWNVYVGAALRSDDVFPGKAADDNDFLKTYAVWADADTEEQVDNARQRYRDLGISPPFVVVTGRTPERRAQLWWPLESPISDIETLRATVRGIADVLGTDHGVLTGKQLMRLAGSLAWPKPNKPGRILEQTEIVLPTSAAREFSLEQLHRAFPPVDRSQGGAVHAEVEVARAGALGLDERVMDGREGYAFRLVRATLRELIGSTGVEHDADELYREVAPIYFRKTDQVRPGRGPEFLKQKCVEAVRAYHAGQIPGMRDLEEAVMSWADRAQESTTHDPLSDKGLEEEFGSAVTAPAKLESQPFRASEFAGEPPPRRWVVPEWIVEGAVNSLYGDGGLGKTLLAQQLAAAAALGGRWLGMPVTQGAVLAVLCEDERDELHRRHNDIKAAMGHAVGNPFDDVWLWPRVGDENVLIHWNSDGSPVLGAFTERLIAKVAELQPSLLILDTLADFYAGNEISRPQVNYFVKTILGGLIKARAAEGHALTILLLGHPSVAGKASGSGISGSTAWNNAVRSRMYLTRPDEGSSDERVLTRGKANYASSGDDTAIRLFYAEGVLHAAEDAEDGDSILWAAQREVGSLVDQAWRSGAPYNNRKGHARYIYLALPAVMEKGGFGPQIARQAIRECIEDGRIRDSKSNGKAGFRGSDAQ